MVKEYKDYRDIDALLDILQQQRDYFDANLDKPKNLLTTVSKLDDKYKRPILFYMIYDVLKTHQKEKTDLMEGVESSLDKYVKETLGDGFSVQFRNVRNLLFDLSYDGIELARFSLMLKGYSTMRHFLTEEQYVSEVERIKQSIESNKEEGKFLFDRIERLKRYNANYWLLLKECRTVKDILQFFFCIKKNKKGLEINIATLEARLKTNEKSFRDSYEADLKSLEDKRELTSKFGSRIQDFFAEIGYTAEDMAYFYD